MKRNVGNLDRILRIAFGLALVGLALTDSIAGPWGYLGLIPLATGVFGSCPVYGLLGIKTCRVADRASVR